jgi:KDO2-lipid IV(A) lauroyltransferase
VVFRRDPMPRFERLRAEQRARLGVIEAAVDEGLPVWVRLRDALERGDVVLMQGDRVMSGQPGVPVPFFGRLVAMPVGPVKLAMAARAPMLPVFAPRTAGGKVLIVIHEPIELTEQEIERREPLPALMRLTAVIESMVRRYPEQWLMPHAMWQGNEVAAETRVRASA